MNADTLTAIQNRWTVVGTLELSWNRDYVAQTSPNEDRLQRGIDQAVHWVEFKYGPGVSETDEMVLEILPAFLLGPGQDSAPYFEAFNKKYGAQPDSLPGISTTCAAKGAATDRRRYDGNDFADDTAASYQGAARTPRNP